MVVGCWLMIVGFRYFTEITSQVLYQHSNPQPTTRHCVNGFYRWIPRKITHNPPKTTKEMNTKLNNKYCVGLGEVLFDVLPTGPQLGARQLISLIMQVSMDCSLWLSAL